MSYDFRKELADIFKRRRESELIKPKDNISIQNNNSSNSNSIHLNKKINNNNKFSNNLEKNNDIFGNYYINIPNKNMLKPKNIESLRNKKSRYEIKIINNREANSGINFNKKNANSNFNIIDTNNKKNEEKRAKSLINIINKKLYFLNENNINIKISKSLDNKHDKMNMNINNFINQIKEKKKEISHLKKSKNEIIDSKRLRTETIAQKSITNQPVLTKRYSVIKDIKLISKNIYQEDDFNVINICGRGAYGTVLQACLKKDPNKIFAIKKLDRNLLNSVNRLYQAYLENQILNELDNPFIIKIYGAFEENKVIHLVMEYLSKGDLSYFIKTNYPLADDIIKYYSAQIVLFLEYMQKMKLIHRDLKPQNIMIDEKGNLKIIDFGTVQKIGYYYDKKQMKFKEEKLLERLDFEFIGGIDNYFIPDKGDDNSFEEEDEEEEEEEEEEESENENENKSDNINDIKKDIYTKKNKINQKKRKRKKSFVGTVEYMSPEVIAERPTEYGTDIWALGIILYQMYYNRTPFKNISTYLTFHDIKESKFEFPNDSSIPKSAKDLIRKILVVDPKKRLGGGSQNSDYDINSLKKHPFFEGIKWNELQNKSPPHMKNYKYFEQKQNRYSICYSANDNRINNNAKIIRKGMLNKKTTWFNYSKRYTILDSTPRLLTKNPNYPDKIKEIPLTKKCKIKLVDNNCFDLNTPIKTYRFKGTNNDGNDWAGDILDAINSYGKEE